MVVFWLSLGLLADTSGTTIPAVSEPTYVRAEETSAVPSADDSATVATP